MTKEGYLEALEKLRKETNEPQRDEKKVSLISNKIKTKTTDFTQFKVAIPKKFAYDIGLNAEDFQAIAIYEKNPEKIIIEITKKNG